MAGVESGDGGVGVCGHGGFGSYADSWVDDGRCVDVKSWIGMLVADWLS
jgi:hypothetical protein